MPHANGLEKILFVDDNPIFLASIRRLLGKSYRVVTAESGREALDMLARQGPFAVAVTDLKMPEMDGITLLRRIKEEFPDTVRMLFTGYANLQTAIEAVNDGYVFRILTKPCPEEAIRQASDAAVEQHRLIRDRSELASLRKIRKAMEGIIMGFSALVETRDPYTAGHQRRVTTLSEAIARRLNFDEDRLEGLRMAALVHDVGKLYVPAEFLNKPGKLSDAEMTIIKTHPKVGFDILDPVDFPWPVSRIVLQHHERLDGSGYPAGLRGTEILGEARVIAVADVVEAISSHRPYRASLGLERALREIEVNAGGLYEEAAVDACLRLFKDEDHLEGWR